MLGQKRLRGHRPGLKVDSLACRNKGSNLGLKPKKDTDGLVS